MHCTSILIPTKSGVSSRRFPGTLSWKVSALAASSLSRTIHRGSFPHHRALQGPPMVRTGAKICRKWRLVYPGGRSGAWPERTSVVPRLICPSMSRTSTPATTSFGRGALQTASSPLPHKKRETTPSASPHLPSTHTSGCTLTSSSEMRSTTGNRTDHTSLSSLQSYATSIRSSRMSGASSSTSVSARRTSGTSAKPRTLVLSGTALLRSRSSLLRVRGS